MGGGDRVQSTGYVRLSGKNYVIALQLRDRVMGSGPTQQAMLSEGSDPANPPNQNILFSVEVYTGRLSPRKLGRAGGKKSLEPGYGYGLWPWLPNFLGDITFVCELLTNLLLSSSS